MCATRRIFITSSLRQAYTPHTRHARQLPCRLRRTFYTEAIETAGEVFMDLAIALPIPPTLPPYSTTIILLTVVSRLAFTLPFSIWAQQRIYRMDHTVRPTLQKMVPQVQQKVLASMKADGLFTVPNAEFNDPIERNRLKAKYNEHLIKETKTLMSKKQRDMVNQYKCRPLWTVAMTVGSQVPLFLGSSLVLAHLSRSPTPFDLESFWVLTSLSHADSTNVIPIIMGLVTFANVESSAWFMTGARKQQLEKENKKGDKSADEGKVRFSTSIVIKRALRFGSFVRVVLAAMLPGSVALYWLSNATFGLIQTILIDRWMLERSRKEFNLVNDSSSVESRTQIKKQLKPKKIS